MVEYKIKRTLTPTTNGKLRISYGISVYKNSSLITTIDDISDNKNSIEKLVKNFNKYELDIAHLEQAIEDFLYDLSYD